ncbi:MAG: glycoside hydrolase family 43 protein [Odoribacter sp.]|nr:glycoside hydrolase family 43 protein [Odoribacter sp.]
MLRLKGLNLLVICLIGICITSCKKKEQEVYLFSYFTGDSRNGLHLAYSYDGLTWEALRDGASFLRPAVGKDSLMRDPSIARGKDGTFHMVWTTGWWDRGIGYASSKDLVNWSEQKNIPVMEYDTATRNTWAPEVYYDEKDDIFYIIWASTITGLYPEVETTPNEKGLNHRLYYTTTKDFQSFASTKLFYDPDFSVIDGAIAYKDGKYWFVIKNEVSVPTEKNLRVTFTDDLKKGFPKEVSENISGKSWVEGPAPLVVGEYVYVYFDKYREKKYGAIHSKDGKEWEDVSELVTFPKGTRHGTAFKVPVSILENLK